MPVLTPKLALINTATVTIRTLSLGKKQVTLAVFRQLPRAALLDAAGAPLGTIWGTVNYHPDKYCPGTEKVNNCLFSGTDHRHVVWKFDDELHHSVVYKPAGWQLSQPALVELTALVILRILSGWTPDDWQPGSGKLSSNLYRPSAPVNVDVGQSLSTVFHLSDDMKSYLTARHKADGSDDQRWLDDWRRRHDVLTTKLGFPQDVPMEVICEAARKREVTTEAEMQKSRQSFLLAKETWALILAAPQLFIAV